MTRNATRRGSGWMPCSAVSLSAARRARLSLHLAVLLLDACPVTRHSQVTLESTTPVTPRLNSSWRRPNEQSVGSRPSAKPMFRLSGKLAMKLSSHPTDCIPATFLETLLRLLVHQSNQRQLAYQSSPRQLAHQSNQPQYQRNQSNLTQNPTSLITRLAIRTNLLTSPSSIHIFNPKPTQPNGNPTGSCSSAKPVMGVHNYPTDPVPATPRPRLLARQINHYRYPHPYRKCCLYSPTTRLVIYMDFVTSASTIPKSIPKPTLTPFPPPPGWPGNTCDAAEMQNADRCVAEHPSYTKTLTVAPQGAWLGNRHGPLSSSLVWYTGI